MFKRLLVVLLAIVPLWLAAQEMPFALKTRTRYSASGMIGKVAVDSTDYYRARFIQEYKYKKFGIGLDLDFLFDEDYHIRKTDWDKLDDIPGKIYYLRYAELNEPFYFHFGGFPNYTIGNGFVMHNYSNMYYYPEVRNLGLTIGGSPKWPLKPSFQIFSSNVEKPQIISFATRVHPIPDSTFNFVDIFDVGFGVYGDRDQKSGLKDSTDPTLYQSLNIGKKAPVAVYSLDYRLQFVNKPQAIFGTYAEMAHITGGGTGFILPGVYGDFKFMVINLEYRINGKEFYPGFFDSNYERDRAVADTLGKITTKEESIQSMDASYGILCNISGLIGKKIRTNLGWQNLYGDKLERGKSLWFGIGVDTQYGRLEKVKFSYSKSNVESLDLGKVAVPNAAMSASVMFSWNEKRKIFIIGQYSEKYKDKEGDIKWWKDTKRSASVGVKVNF
ncbi:MAG: hypothetical protein PHY48_09755 [Candidatus Cloacimonetes bacterium]|nr:hypothetical protein [Candidatus Cloacimonadota bacterium]